MNHSAIATALRETNAALLDAFEAVPVADFFAGSAERWSPAHRLQHLTQSNRPLASALGRPDVPTPSANPNSRSYDEVVAVYRQALASGAARATGRFAPDLTGVEPTAEGKKEVLERFRSASSAVVDAMSTWTEDRLDSLSLPHPALGPLTVREMLYFTHFHNRHHGPAAWSRSRKDP